MLIKLDRLPEIEKSNTSSKFRDIILKSQSKLKKKVAAKDKIDTEITRERSSTITGKSIATNSYFTKQKKDAGKRSTLILDEALSKTEQFLLQTPAYTVNKPLSQCLANELDNSSPELFENDDNDITSQEDSNHLTFETITNTNVSHVQSNINILTNVLQNSGDNIHDNLSAIYSQDPNKLL